LSESFFSIHINNFLNPCFGFVATLGHISRPFIQISMLHSIGYSTILKSRSPAHT
jgi:hypothetical protein